MKQITMMLMLVLCALTPAWAAGGKEKEASLKYDLTCAGTGLEGTYLATVSVYVPKVPKNSDVLRKAAVHGVIFKGINAAKGCSAQRPLASNPNIEQEKADFFETFFKEGGGYLRYATIVEGSWTVAKTGKKEYRVTATVSLQKDQLRKYLEQEKVISGFSDMF